MKRRNFFTAALAALVGIPTLVRGAASDTVSSFKATPCPGQSEVEYELVRLHPGHIGVEYVLLRLGPVTANPMNRSVHTVRYL